MKKPSVSVRRGEIYWLDWNPARGSEQAGRRPALVVQENPASSNPNYPLTIVLAITTKGRNLDSHVSIQPTVRNGLSALSYVKCEQIMTVSKDRLQSRLGEIDWSDLDRVEQAVKRVLALR